MICPACCASMRGPVRVTLGTGAWWGGDTCEVVWWWTCPCGCVVVVPVGGGRP